MTVRRKGNNVLVMQSGGPTAVLNRSLAGIVDEASERRALGTLYGASHGLAGLLKGELIRLERPSGAAWRRIARAPGAALEPPWGQLAGSLA